MTASSELPSASPTQFPGEPSSGSRELPADLQREASRRLELLSLALGSGFTLALLLNNAIHRAALYTLAHPLLQDLLCLSVIGASGALLWLSRSGRAGPARLLSIGLAYEVAVGLAISIGDNLAPLADDRPLASLSWLFVWIVLFPLVVPATRGWTLLAAVATATTWPLAFFVGQAIGNTRPAWAVVGLNVLENYIAAILALAPAFIVGRLGAAVARARELGSYELVRRLGQGGMGEVWLARHRLLARPAAVKLIRPEALGLGSGPLAQSAFRRFELEAQTTASLRSPHTVALYDYGVGRDGSFYYVMEVLEGQDLDSLVRRFGALDAARAVYLLLQACDSLAEAHRLGLIHRDVKPANLFVSRQGARYDFLKVLDFGLVKSTLQDSAPLTVGDAILGTPAFMAPELALGGAIDGRADVYGLGCVAYWMVTARTVFDGTTAMELALKHVQAPPVPPSQRTELPLSPGLEQLILRCLEKDPERRPAGMEALARELLACDVGPPWSAERAREWWEAHAWMLESNA